MLIKIAILLLLFIGAMFIALMTSRSRTKLIKAHAGGIRNASGGDSHISYSKMLEKIVDIDKKKVLSLKKYTPVEVEGNCLASIGIEDGDILISEKIKIEKLKEILNPFDIILIKVSKDDDKEIYKIRIVEEVLDDNEIKTFYFEERVNITYKRYSSKNHKFNQVQGIILYKKVA